MRRYLLSCLALFVGIFAHAQATDLVVDCQTPGWLSSKINYSDQQTVRRLKVTGYINSTDLNFLGTLIKSRNLQEYLDLSDANIVSSSGDNILGSDCFAIHDAENIRVKILKFPNSLISAEYVLNTLYVDSLYWNTNNVKGKNFAYGRDKLFCNTLILGENVTTIPGYAFENHYKLMNIIFSKKTNFIGEKAFLGCEIEKANINELNDLVYIGDKAFRNSSPDYIPFSQDTLVIPRKIVDYNTEAFNYRNHEHVFISSGTSMLSSGVMGKGQWSMGTEFLPDTLFFHMESRTPPTLSFPMRSNYIVYVPLGARNAYMNDSNWKKATVVEVANPMIEISISEKSISLEKGSSHQLYATPIPANADDTTILWNSDNKEVATVSEAGLVTAIAPGTSNIIAMSSDGLIRDTCIVTVNAHAESLSLSSETITLSKIGETYQLTATVWPDNAVDKSVSWKSFNESVCSISSKGLIVTVGYGTSVVMATTVDGGHTAVCTVNVVHGVETVEIGKHEVTMKAKDMVQLKVNVLPDNAYDKTVKWTSSNDSLATVDAEGNVKALAVGEVFVKATSNFNDEASDSCRVTIAKRIEVKDSTIIWNDTTFVYTGLSPQPTWKNTQKEYTATANMPELEKNVGSWETIVTFAFTDGVDTLVVNVPLSYTITPALLTIKANDAERFYSEENPEFTFTYEGFVNDETEETLTQKPVATTTATADSPVGTYPIMVEGAEADNYSIEYVDGTLTVKENPEEVGEDVTDIVMATEVMLKAGENTTLTVSLTTKDTDYIGYQFNLYLPEGISVATDDNGNFLVTEKTGREKVALAVSDGSVLFYTTADKDHDALVSGPLMEIELTADSALDAGNYTVRIERIICATRENKTVSLPSSTVTVTVEKEAEEEVPAVITADDVEGEPASRITLPVFLNNAKDINAFYFDLTLPKGVVVATEKNGQFIASFTGDYGDTMLLSCLPWDASMGTTNNVNTWRFIATPKDNGVFNANAGRVMNVMLDVDKDMAGGIYTARMNVVKLVEANDAASRSGQRFQALQSPSVASWTSYSSITIKTQKPGDVNGDFTVDVADIATVISVMAGDATLGGVAHYADVNHDGVIDVADIATIIDTMAANARRIKK